MLLRRASDGVPRLAALTASALGLVNLVSALTPNARFRGHLLLRIEPVRAMEVFHALAVPASLALLVLAYYLRRRRRDAWRLALAVLVGLAAVNLVKGLDVEEAALSAAGAGLLWAGRGAFTAHRDALGFRVALRHAFGVVGGSAIAALVLVRLVAVHASWGDVLRETGSALVWQPGPIAFADEAGHLPLALGMVGALAVLVSLSLLLRPLAAPLLAQHTGVLVSVQQIVRAHGDDTLAYFKLRRDLQHVFDPSGRAFVSYRVDNGVLLCAGDPVGPSAMVGGAVEAAARLARASGLRLGAVGVSGAAAGLFTAVGCRRLYLGDEAVVETAAFSLEGRAIRKVRQSVTRLEREGYAFGLVEQGALRADDLDALDEVSTAWLAGEKERGFSMALDGIRGSHLGDTLVAIARDRDGRPRGFLQLVPASGGAACSLSMMRRDPETPNGLTEALVARTIEALRDRGVDEVSLNFAVFARFMHAPRTHGERLLGAIARLANPFFQLESLRHFNAKFAPRWEPRYLVFQGVLSLPRIGLAAAWVEGQLPRVTRLS